MVADALLADVQFHYCDGAKQFRYIAELIAKLSESNSNLFFGPDSLDHSHTRLRPENSINEDKRKNAASL